MHYIGDSYPASFDTICQVNIGIAKFLYYHLGKKFMWAMKRWGNYEQAKLIQTILLKLTKDMTKDLIGSTKRYSLKTEFSLS
jgi:hypothetical protein